MSDDNSQTYARQTNDKGITPANSSGGGNERLQGILPGNSKPLVTGEPSTARMSQNTMPPKLSPEVRAKLNEAGPAAAAVRGIVGNR